MGFILVIASIATSVLAVYGLSGLWGLHRPQIFAQETCSKAPSRDVS